MNHPTDDELISAYLDGELSGEELLRAERMLEERPECRQLVEELRAIGGGLRDLPRHKLDDDFADRVLRRAEREMLSSVPPEIAPPATAIQKTAIQTTGPQAPGPQASSNESKAPQTLVSTTNSPIANAPSQKSPMWDSTETKFQPDLLSWRRWRRPAVWSSLAVAAALLIMFLGSPQMQVRQANNHLAQGPAPHVTTESDRTKDSKTRPVGGVNVDARFARSEDGGGRNAANGITDIPSISSDDASSDDASSDDASSDDSAQKPAAENLAKNAGGTVPIGAWSMKTASPRPHEAADGEASQYLNYQGYRGKRGEENNSSYNYFTLQPDGQTSPAQPLTDDVVIVQVNVDSVDAAKQAFHELLAKRQIAWDKPPASGANGDVASENPKGGGKDDDRRGAGQGGAGGDRFGFRSTQGLVTGKAGSVGEKSAATAKDDELATFKPEVAAAAADFGLLREAREQSINRPLDRQQLDSSRLGRERFDRDELSIDRSANEKLGVQKQHLDSEKLAQLKSSEEVDKGQSFRRAVLVEGPPAQLDALIADVAAQKGVVHEVLLRRAAGAAINDIVDSNAADNLSPPNSASLPNMRPEDVAAGGAKLGSATLHEQAVPKDAFGADHDYTDSVPLGGVPSAKVLPPNALPPTGLPPSAPPDHPSATPSVTPMPKNQPMPAPAAPDARNWVEDGKKTEADKPARATNKAEAAKELDNKAVGDSKSGRSELSQMPPGQVRSDKAATDTSAPNKATQQAESTRSQRGTDRARDMRRNKDKVEPPAAPSPAPTAPARGPAETPPAPSAAPKSSASRSLAEPPPAAEKMAEGKAAPHAPVDAKLAPAASQPSPPAPAAVEQMPPEQAKLQDRTPPQVVAPAVSLPDYVSPTTPLTDHSKVAAPADPAPRSHAASQSPAAHSSNAWYGRAQEVMVPEGAFGDLESVQQPRFVAPNEAAKNLESTDEVGVELFSNKPANQAPSEAPEPPAAPVKLKSNTQAVEKSEPAVSELNAAGKVPMRSKPAEGRGGGIDTIKSEAEGQKETADSQSRGMQLRLGEEIRPGGNKPGDGKVRENTRGGAQSDSKNRSQIGNRPVEKKLNDQGNPAQSEALDATVDRFHDPAPRQVAATPPAPRRVIFVFNVRPPAAAAPLTETVPAVRAAPAPAKAE